MKKIYLLLLILIIFSNCILYAQSWNQDVKLVASDRANDDWLGYSVTISQDYAFVAAPIEDHDTAGGDFISGAGSVYVYYNDAGTWVQTQKLVAFDRSTNANFGFSMSVYGDFLAISANSDSKGLAGDSLLTLSGSVYIYKNNSGSWEYYQKIVASDREQAEQFGTAVAIDSNFLFVGVPAEDEGGIGDDVLSFAGGAYVFENIGGTWTEIQKIVPAVRASNDQFGRSVTVSGDYAIIGAAMEDEDESGSNTVSDAGSAYVYHYNGSAWDEAQKITASDREASALFGYSAAMYEDYAIIGAYQEDQDTSNANPLSNAGAAYIFKNTGGVWSQVKKLAASDRDAEDWFGRSVDLFNGYAVVTAYQEDEDATGSNTLLNSGSAYIFVDNSGNWTQVQKITAADRGSEDFFGFSAAIYGNNILLGAYNEDHDALGGNTRTNAGSAYIFHDPSVPMPVELTAFTASISGSAVQLEWQTATEINNYGFEVQREVLSLQSSAGSREFETIGFVKGNGNSSSIKKYSYTDVEINEGKYSYRLKQIDNDGKFEYSPVVEALLTKPDKFALEQNYPNPFNPSTEISYSISKTGKVRLAVYNLLGEEVKILVDETKEAGIYHIKFYSSGLSSGVYFYTLESDGLVQTKKLAILK